MNGQQGIKFVCFLNLVQILFALTLNKEQVWHKIRFCKLPLKHFIFANNNVLSNKWYSFYIVFIFLMV